MKDSERAKIMGMARHQGLTVVDCHSHPGSSEGAWFSPSDIDGITDFAAYARWKLDGKPFAAMVLGETSIDAVIWYDDFTSGLQVDEVRVVGNITQVLIPQGTWFWDRSVRWGFADDE